MNTIKIIKVRDLVGEDIAVEVWKNPSGRILCFAQNILARGIIGEGRTQKKAIEDLKTKLTKYP